MTISIAAAQHTAKQIHRRYVKYAALSPTSLLDEGMCQYNSRCRSQRVKPKPHSEGPCAIARWHLNYLQNHDCIDGNSFCLICQEAAPPAACLECAIQNGVTTRTIKGVSLECPPETQLVCPCAAALSIDIHAERIEQFRAWALKQILVEEQTYKDYIQQVEGAMNVDLGYVRAVSSQISPGRTFHSSKRKDTL